MAEKDPPFGRFDIFQRRDPPNSDLIESPVERTKKAKAVLFREEKEAYTKDSAARQPSDRGDDCAGILQRK